MKINDRSLRIAVWIIAISLAVIALKPLFVVENAQAQLGDTVRAGKIVPFASQGGGVFWAYDSDTMAIYVYNTVNGKGYYLGKLSQLGQKMDQAGVNEIPFLR